MTVRATTTGTAGDNPAPAPSAANRRLPPIAEVAVGSVVLMLTGGVYLAAHLPGHPPLGPAEGLVIGGGALSLADLAMLSRIRPFSWPTFFLVARWALLAYGVIAGMLEYVFVFDHTRGATLVVLTVALAVFAIDVPTILAFTVARYQETTPPPTRVHNGWL